MNRDKHMPPGASGDNNLPDPTVLREWSVIEPFYTALLGKELAPRDVPAWLASWSDLQKIVWEARAGLKRDRSRDLSDEAAGAAFQRFVEEVFSPFHVVTDALTAKLLGVSGWTPAPEHVQMLRHLRDRTELFREENVAIEAEVSARLHEYDELSVSMTATVDGREVIGPEPARRSRDQDRAIREAAWRAGNQPWLRARGKIDEIVLALLAQRRQLARNAGLPDYRAYRWRELGRLDYTPADCLRLHDAIQAEIVPLAARRHDRLRARIGLDTIRPWDLEVDSERRQPPQPFEEVTSFEAGMARVFSNVDPELGALFERMRDGYLDLGRRKGKQGGGEQWGFPLTGLPYVIVGSDGTDEGVKTLMHEMGHAYHNYLGMTHQELEWNQTTADELAELAAFTLYHLAAPYLGSDRGGFYSPEDAARTHARFIEDIVVRYLPDISLADTFEQWVYSEAPQDVRPADLDATWLEISARYQPWMDWTGLESEHAAGWQRQGLLFTQPFYEVSYSLALFGSLQVWRRAQTDPAGAWRDYRAALCLGSTRSVPELYEAIGASLPFDRKLVHEAARFVESYLDIGPS